MAEEYLQQWLICGPFYSDRGWSTLDEDYLFGEQAVRPHDGMLSFGRRWQPWDTNGEMLEFLNAPLRHTLFVTGYAHTYVHVPSDREALLLCGSDDGIKVWLNGDVVWLNDVNRAAVPDEDRAPITLKTGWNSVLVKVRQGMAHWQFAMRISAPDGRPMEDLRSAREAENQAQADSPVQLGLRVRFTSETYTLTGSGLTRKLQFEAGNLTSSRLQDIRIAAGSTRLQARDLEPGETQVTDQVLPLADVLSVLRGQVSGSAGGQAVSTRCVVSQPCRLLRDLFAPAFVPAESETPAPPHPLSAFDWQPLARDGRGCYLMADPPGLRQYLGGITGRFPMKAEDSEEVQTTCALLLQHALAGDRTQFEAALQATRLPELERT